MYYYKKLNTQARLNIKGMLYRKSLSFDHEPIWFTDAPPSADLRVINNDFKRQPRIRRGQIDTIDQAMEKWLWRTRLTFSVQ